jgi:uncharacterized protein YcfJ
MGEKPMKTLNLKSIHKMKNIGVGMAALMVCTSALANHNSSGSQAASYRYVNVIEAEPVMDTVRSSSPRKHCRYKNNSRVHYNSNDDAIAGAVVGGVIGAVIGSQAGHRDNPAGAAVGAVVGGVIGAGVASNASGNHHVHNERRYDCDTYYQDSVKNKVVGYDVRFYLDGDEYSLFSRHYPGRRMKVKVTVEIAE